MAEVPEERLGFKRTLALAATAGIFAFLGVLIADRIIHTARQSRRK